MPGLARTLIAIGLALVLIGAVIGLAGRLGIGFGRLPGDFVFRREGFTLFLPLGTSLVLSVVLSLLLYFFRR